MSAAGAVYDLAKIEECLRQMFRDAASTDRQRNFRKGDGKGKKGFGKGKNPKPYSDKTAVFLAEDDDVDMEDVVDEDEAYEYDEDGAYAAENFYDGEYEDGSPDENEMEALANFMTAKKKLAQARQSSQRGFAGRGGRGSSVGSSSSAKGGGGKGRGSAAESLAAKKAKSRCADCGQYGHWHGDPECSKVQTGAVPKHKPRSSLGRHGGILCATRDA